MCNCFSSYIKYEKSSSRQRTAAICHTLHIHISFIVFHNTISTLFLFLYLLVLLFFLSLCFPLRQTLEQFVDEEHYNDKSTNENHKSNITYKIKLKWSSTRNEIITIYTILSKYQTIYKIKKKKKTTYQERKL